MSRPFVVSMKYTHLNKLFPQQRNWVSPKETYCRAGAKMTEISFSEDRSLFIVRRYEYLSISRRSMRLARLENEDKN